MLGLLLELAVEDRHADSHSAAPEALRQFSTHHRRYQEQWAPSLEEPKVCGLTRWGEMDSNHRPLAPNPAFLRVLHPRLQPICTPIVHRFAPLLQRNPGNQNLCTRGLSAAIDPWAFSPRVQNPTPAFLRLSRPREWQSGLDCRSVLDSRQQG